MFIKLCYAPTEGLPDPADREELLCRLSPARRRKLLRFRMPADRIRCYAAGRLLDRLLQPYGLSEGTAPFSVGPEGKPYLNAEAAGLSRSLFFNLSHSGGMVMAALSDWEIGCDIEQLSDRRGAQTCLQLAERFFHPQELRLLQAISPEEEAAVSDAFTQIWVKKESVIKADGRGLQLDLRGFSVFETPSITLNSGSFLLRASASPEGYRSACAVRLPEGVEPDAAAFPCSEEFLTLT